MKQLTKKEKNDFLTKHLRHRLTLLRTLKHRKKRQYNYNTQGDIYRCVKDSNLIAVRLLLDFLGLRGEYDGRDYILKSNLRKSGNYFQNDVKVDQFIGRLLDPKDVPRHQHRLLAGVYARADKELAHLTLIFNDEFNNEDVLIEAATATEELLRDFLYKKLKKRLPKIDN